MSQRGFWGRLREVLGIGRRSSTFRDERVEAADAQAAVVRPAYKDPGTRFRAQIGRAAAKAFGQVPHGYMVDAVHGDERLFWVKTSIPQPGRSRVEVWVFDREQWRHVDLDVGGFQVALSLARYDLFVDADRACALRVFAAIAGDVIDTIDAARALVHLPKAREDALRAPSTPADDIVVREWAAPVVDGTTWTFLAHARMPGSTASSIVRIGVDLTTHHVVAQRLGAGVTWGRPLHVAVGRPWVADDGAVVVAPVDRPVSATTHGDRWRAVAAGEHASVASFARSTIELLAVGAPLSLVQRTQEAALDEVRHARMALVLARRAESGSRAAIDAHDAFDRAFDRAFGPLPSLPLRPASLATLATTTLVEAAVPETLGAAVAAVAARLCRDPQVAAVVAGIAADEELHAALAWDIVAWCTATCPEARAAVADLAASLSRPPQVSSTTSEVVDVDDDGLLTNEASALVEQGAFVERVLPRLRAFGLVDDAVGLADR